MKKTKELVFILIIVILVIGNVVYLIKQDAKKENKNAELINITQCSEEFMNNYFEELDKIQENEDKENILIITSETKIQDGYGASEIVEAPNNQYILKYESQEEKNDALENFNTNKELISVEENIAYTLTGDVKYNSWGIEKMGLDQAIEVVNSKDLNEVTVAVIDSGCNIETFNKKFPEKIIETYNVLDTEVAMTDEVGHGTNVAGIIAEGTPSNVKILPIKVTADGVIYNTDIIKAINYVVYYNKADVINMSFVSYSISNSMKQAIDAANDKNIICVAAAGNDNTSINAYPAAYSNTISISACNSNLNKSSFSNYGSTITFTAPGEGISSINASMSGTSAAAPHAVSAVAIIKSYNSSYTLENVINLLKSYSIDLGNNGRDNYFGYGLINFAEVSYCDCNCEKCDSINCSNCQCEKCIFEEINVLKKIEVVEPLVTSYNYGSITNLSPIQLRIYNDEDYIDKYLLELEGCEIIGYDPYCYDNQIVTIKYQGEETSFELSARDIYDSGWEYEKIDDENIRLTKYLIETYGEVKSLEKIYVPQRIDGYAVKALGENLFFEENLKNVILPPTVTEIGTKAFYGSGLENIDIQSEDIQIGDYAFSELESLENINSNIISLGKGAFSGCVTLNSINFSDTIETIGENAFSECNNLENITLPSSVTSIGARAFSNTNIKNITIPNGVTKIEDYVFSGCVNLDNITIPEGVTEIGDYAFVDCNNLKNIYIPKTVTGIGRNVFTGCAGLESIVVDENNEYYDNRDNCNALIETHTNTLLVGTYNTIIPSTVKIIGEGAFAYNFRLKKLTIPESVEEIQTKAFYYCIYLTEINLPKDVKVIGQEALWACFRSIVWVYRDSYAKTYAQENYLYYQCIDPSEIYVEISKKEYKAFETVKRDGMYIMLSYDDGRTEKIEDEINIKYINENSSFRYGDTYFTVSAYSKTGEYIEERVMVTVTKAVPEYILPSNIEVIKGNILSEIQLPEGFYWMDETQVIEETGNIIYKARYIPDDTVNYEIIENIEITILVKAEKIVITPDIIVNERTYDGTNSIDLRNITISNLETTDYTIESAILDSIDVGDTTAKIKIRLTDSKFQNYTLNTKKQEEEYTVNVKIIPAELVKPSKVDKIYTYNGNDQQFELIQFDNTKMNITGNIRKNAGEQIVTISLATENYIWEDKTTEDITFTFEIEKANANIMYEFSDENYIYDEQMHTGTLNITNPDNAKVKYMDENGEYTLDDMPKYCEVGSYTIKYRIFVDDNYEDVTGSNNVMIYGIEEIEPTLELKNNILIVKDYDNSFTNICEKIKLYATSCLYKHYDKDKKLIDVETTKTGDSIIININNEREFEYIISVLGDVNGDGKLDQRDIFEINKHRLDNVKLKDEYLQAGDVNEDGKSDIRDIFEINRVRLQNIEKN